jgi:hypothetical protein
MAATQDSTCFSWDELSDDSKFVYEALTRLGFTEFSTLPIPDMRLVLAPTHYLKRTQDTS